MHPEVHILDLGALTPADLEALWQHEIGLWRERFLWDISDVCATLRRLVQGRRLPGKAVQVNGRTVGYTYYAVAERLGIIANTVVAPEWNATDLGEILLRQIVQEMRQQGVSRIQSLFISVDCPWLIAVLESEGFRTYWREFLRFELRHMKAPLEALTTLEIDLWRPTHLYEAATVLQAAYEAGIEAEIHMPYRTVDGCHTVLENLVHQGSCGALIDNASAMARHRARLVGFDVVTQIAPRQAHLTQIAVLPEYQGRGVGRQLLDYSLQQLADRQFEALSLIVSRANQRAVALYEAIGFQSVQAFPVFVWER